MEIKRSTTPAVTAGEELGIVLDLCKSKPTLLLLSGGSALSMLDYVPETVLGPQLTITTLDERFSTDPSVNNFAQIKVTKFYERAQVRGVSEINTLISSNNTLQEAGQRFEIALQDWRAQHPDGVVIATMGMGSDGHTAGIFPNQSGFNFETDDWVAAYDLTPGINLYSKRITATPHFLRTQVRYAIGYITSEEKRFVLNQLQEVNCSPIEVPACIMKEISSVVVVTDIY